MANTPISGFASGAPAQAGDEFVIARSGANFKLTNTNISSFVLAGPTTQLGAADVASGAVAQTLQVQSNTGAATTGPNFTIKGSSGTTAGGSIIFQTHNGTAYGNALTINSNGRATFAPTVDTTNSFAITNVAGSVIASVDATNRRFMAGGAAGGAAFSVSVSTGATTLYDAAYFGWTDGSDASGGTTDVRLYRDGQPNTLALKNAGNAQIFRAYSTTTGPSYGYFASGVTDAGVATADTLFIGTGGAGAAMTKLALVVNGTSALSFSGVDATFPGALVSITKANAASSDPTLSLTGDFGNSAQLIVARNGSSSGYPAHSLNLQLNGSSDGFIIRDNNIFRFSFTRAGLFRIGGTTSSFPALKYSSTGVPLQVRLADDTGDAAFQCGTQTAGGTAFNVNGTGGNSIASVTNTTTGTLLQVLNSTSNPLMTVTDTTSGTLFSVQSTTAATLFSVNDTTSGTLLAVTNSSSTDVFTVSDAGVVNTASNVIIGTTGSGWKMVPTGSTALVFWDTSNSDAFAVGPYNEGIAVTSAGSIGWSSSTSPSLASRDVILARDNAAELALRNGNNGQIFRVYGRYTDGSNYERFFINAPTTAGTAVQIGTQKAGSGTARALELQTDGATRLTINANGSIDLLGSSQINTSGTYQAGGASGGAALATTGLFLASGEQVKWSSTSAWSGGIDAGLGRATVGVVSVTNGSTGAGALQFTEQTAPAAPAANGVRIYAEDNGSGKTRLMALFATGAAQQIAIEP